ncbi:DUF4870 domain-containing protein [Dysgonomonas sp. 25]|uniref:DUF4870 domain-containing protein n=1 Tax=Dysgonomonas sp. 25 TaxID=2302933 RepID=UPI0013D61D03|nr:DUF4870 domain-containing protein [Dysgonomonas sp. 25]NDV68491.1 DUF4870 domain-containing protein [Dysgonomonas sp. 25]
MGQYEDLQQLEQLRAEGKISDEEYQAARDTIHNAYPKIWGMEQNNFLMLMHFSQLTGFVLPLIMWLLNKENPVVNKHGENIANFMISMYIYMTVAAFSMIVLIGFLLLPALLIIQLIYIIRIAMDANKDIYTEYPFCIKIFPAK